MKKCSHCKLEKEETEFYRSHCQCKVCFKKALKKYLDKKYNRFYINY